MIEDPPCYKDDEGFKLIVGEELKGNDSVDNALIYAVYKDAVHYLITEDQGIHTKARKLGLDHSIFSVNESIIDFKSNIPSSNINTIPQFERKKGYSIDLNDEIFDSLKEEYDDFNGWWREKVCKDRNRNIWVYTDENKKLNAILVLKIEEPKDFDEYTPPLTKEKKLKICTFKVSEMARGHKLGERLLKMAIEYAAINGVEEIYLTHYTRTNDELVYLIEQFGFYKYAVNVKAEEVYLKKMVNKEYLYYDDLKLVEEVNQKYFPSFYDGALVKKHIVPIIPEFHKKLFPDCNQFNMQLSLFNPELKSEGNSIKKAYICKAPTKKVGIGDILLFYRTEDHKCITTLGVVESIYYNQTNPEEIYKLISKRTVFNLQDIKNIATSPMLVILFSHNFHLTEVVDYNTLRENKLVGLPVQSITEVSEDSYREIIRGNIDECFIIN